jgi:hypothetical protein
MAIGAGFPLEVGRQAAAVVFMMRRIGMTDFTGAVVNSITVGKRVVAGAIQETDGFQTAVGRVYFAEKIHEIITEIRPMHVMTALATDAVVIGIGRRKRRAKQQYEDAREKPIASHNAPRVRILVVVKSMQ